MESTPVVTGAHMTKLQSIKGEIPVHSSVIWKAEQGEVQNPCPHESHTLTYYWWDEDEGLQMSKQPAGMGGES